MPRCEECLHFDVCDALEANDIAKVPPLHCGCFKNAADVVEAETICDKIIRKSAEVSDYWLNDVKRYRATQGYSDIEHEIDNFLRGYKEAVEDMLAILEGREEQT